MKNTIIRGMLALLLVFGLALTGCPIAGGGSGPGELQTEVPEEKTITISGLGEWKEGVRIEATLRQEPSLRPRALTAEAGTYDYKMYLVDVLIQQGVLVVKADPAAPATAQIFEFAPITSTAQPEGNSDKGFTLKVTESGVAMANDSKPIVVTEDSATTLAALIDAGVLEESDDVEAMQSAVDEIVEEAMEEAEVAAPPPAATLQPALKTLLQGTWILQDPDEHKNEFLQTIQPNYGSINHQAGIGAVHVYTVPEEGTSFTITGNGYEGSQKVILTMYGPGDDATLNSIKAQLEAGTYEGEPLQVVDTIEPYVEDGSVSFTTVGGRHYVRIVREVSEVHETAVGGPVVNFEVKFSNSNKTIKLVGDDAETLYMEGNTWIKQQ